LATQEETRIFALASELLDVRIVYEKADKLDKSKLNLKLTHFTVFLGKATTLLLLCEHEIIAIDLMDDEYRCMLLNFLQCVDSSSITTIQVQTVTNNDFFRYSKGNQYSKRKQLFGTARQCDNDPRSLIFTGYF
jgi:hypothetical protein